MPLLCEGVSAVGDGGASAEGGGDGNDLGDFLLGGLCLASLFSVNFDAVGALGGKGDGEGHEFLIFDGNGSVGHGGFVEGPESFHRLGCVGVKRLEFGEVFHVVHGMSLKKGLVIDHDSKVVR